MLLNLYSLHNDRRECIIVCKIIQIKTETNFHPLHQSEECMSFKTKARETHEFNIPILTETSEVRT